MAKRRSLEETRELASAHLLAISSLFVPGRKLTLLVRSPEAPDGSQDFCLTDDDFDRAIAALMIRKAEEKS